MVIISERQERQFNQDLEALRTRGRLPDLNVLAYIAALVAAARHCRDNIPLALAAQESRIFYATFHPDFLSTYTSGDIQDLVPLDIC